MPSLMYLAVANAACAGVLALVAVAVGRWLRRPALTHCVWLLVLVKLVTPPLFPIPLEWLPAAPPAETANASVAPAPPVVDIVTGPDVAGPPTADDVWLEMELAKGKKPTLQQLVAARARAQEQADAVSQADMTPQTPAPALTARPEAPAPAPPTVADTVNFVLTILGGVWLIGSALWFVRAVRRLARFERLLHHARPAPERVLTLAARLAREFGLRRCPDVLLLPAPLPPMIWAALGRVRLLLPAGLVERLDDEQLAALLAHELAHVRRGDHWVRRLEFVVLGLYWWYPLAWWARTRLQVAEEECCDAWVVEALPAHAYASAIVATVDFLANDLAPVPALASGLGRLDGLKRRLTLILTGTAPKRLNVAGRLAVVVLGLALLPLLPTLARSQKKPDAPVANSDAVKVEDADPRDEALAFRPTPLNLTGGDNEVAALAVSRDGRYLAAGIGAVDRPGEVRVWTIPDHKEVLAYATAQGVTTVAFSRDGEYLASCGYDGLAVVREFPSGKVVCVLSLGGTACLSFAPDGRTLVTATESRTIKVWNTATGNEIHRLDNEQIRNYCVAYSPDGKWVAVGGGDLRQPNVPNQVTLWDTTTWKPAGKLVGHAGPVMSVAFSADSTLIATGSTDATARLWQVDGFKLLGALDGHENWVKALAFTPSGKTLITGSHDGTVRLWDVAKQMPLTRLDGHVAPVRAVAVSPDGKQLFSGGAQRILKVWDLATQKELASYQPRHERPGDESIILAMAYSRDGKLLAAAQENGMIALRNAANGDLLRMLEGHEDAVNCLVFTKDSKTLITGSSDRTVRLWDVASGKARATLTGHTSWVYALALSPDGKTLASTGYDKIIRLWDLESRKELATLTGHKGAVRSLAFAPDGKTLASGAGDQTIKLWDVETRKEMATLTGHDGTVRSLTFSPDGKTLVSGSEDATVRLWDVETRKERAAFKGHTDKVSAVSFSPRGRYVVSTGMDNTCRLWDATTGQAVQTLRGHNDAVTCLAWTPDGRFLATAGYDKSVKLWIVTIGTLRLLTGHTGPVEAAAFSPDGKYILSCSGWPAGDKTMRLWDAETGKEIRKFEGHTGPIVCAVFSVDGKRALSSSLDKTVRLWDVETGKMLRAFEGHEDEVWSVAFSPDGKRAASGSHDKTVRIWDLETGKCLHVLHGPKAFVRAVVFTADGQCVVAGDRDNKIRVWDVNKGTELQRIDLPAKGGVYALALSPDGKRIAAGHGSAVRIVDLETGKQVRQFDGHDSGVFAVAWAPDGKTVLSGSYDTSARLWDVETGRELHVFRGHRNWVWAVNFSSDGRRIVTAGGGAKQGDQYVPGNDFAIRVWPMPDTSPMVGRVMKTAAKAEK